MFKFKKDKPDKKWRTYAVVAFVTALIVNGLAGSTTILGGVDTAQVSNNYPNLFAPAGFTFSIWGLIYLLLIGFCLYLFEVFKVRESKLKKAQVNHLAQVFALSSVLNAAWLFAWQYQILGLSVVLMTGLLASLIYINNSLRGLEFSRKEWALVKLPFSVYFGWITVATIANVTTWLVSINWDGFGTSDVSWMIFVLILGAVIGIATALKNHDWVYLLVFVWAYSGILFKHISTSGFDGQYPAVITAVTILIAIIGSTTVQLITPQKA